MTNSLQNAECSSVERKTHAKLGVAYAELRSLVNISNCAGAVLLPSHLLLPADLRLRLDSPSDYCSGNLRFAPCTTGFYTTHKIQYFSENSLDVDGEREDSSDIGEDHDRRIGERQFEFYTMHHYLGFHTTHHSARIPVRARILLVQYGDFRGTSAVLHRSHGGQCSGVNAIVFVVVVLSNCGQ